MRSRTVPNSIDCLNYRMEKTAIAATLYSLAIAIAAVSSIFSNPILKSSKLLKDSKATPKASI